MWGNSYQDGMGAYGYPRQATQRSGYGGYGQNVPNMQWIRVRGVSGAREVNVPPGGEAWIMDETRPVFYFKHADVMGQSTLKAFRFEEIEPDEPPRADARYVTHDDMGAVMERISRLEAAMGGQKNE
jgi:hypothetical protein